MQLMHGMIKDMKVGNCRSKKFFVVDVHRGSVLTTALYCYVKGSNHGIHNRLPIVVIVQK